VEGQAMAVPLLLGCIRNSRRAKLIKEVQRGCRDF
jgi:hypothetical protein